MPVIAAMSGNSVNPRPGCLTKTNIVLVGWGTARHKSLDRARKEARAEARTQRQSGLANICTQAGCQRLSKKKYGFGGPDLAPPKKVGGVWQVRATSHWSLQVICRPAG
jgi:hypothetical protein